MKHVANGTTGKIKPGYIYVLTHPSDPNLYKIGQTILDPFKRMAQHNSDYKKYAGQIVQETGQKWELKTFIEVPDPYHAESAFWASTPFADIPFLGGIEIQKMEWECVQNGLEAAKRAGVRPAPNLLSPHFDYSHTIWIRNLLKGSGITLLNYIDRRESGIATFKCVNRHRWSTRIRYVADGEGCPICGMGKRYLAEMHYYSTEDCINEVFGCSE